MNDCMNNRQCRPEDKRTNPCECTRDFLPEVMTVTMAYVPFQLNLSHFSTEDALSRGTLFCELDKPFRGRCTS